MSMDFCDREFGGMMHQLKNDVHAPLFYTLLWLVMRLAGLSESVARLPAAIAAIATLPILYLFVRRLAGMKAAVLSSLVLACSPFFIEFGRETHPYSLSAFLSVLSWLFFVDILRGGRIKTAILYGLATGLLLLTFYPAVLVPAGHLLCALVLRISRKKRILIAQGWALGFVVFSPWLAVFIRQLTEDHIGVIEQYFPQGVGIREIMSLHGDLFLGTAWRTINPFAGRLAAVAIITAGMLLLRRKRGGPRRVYQNLAAAPLFLSTGLFTLVCLYKPIYLSRYMILAAPFAAVFSGMALAGMKPGARIWGIILVLAWSLGGLAGYHRIMPREDWRGPAEYLVSNMGPCDVIVTDHINARSCLSYYMKIRGRPDAGSHVFDYKLFIELTEGRFPDADRSLYYLERPRPRAEEQLKDIKALNTFVESRSFDAGFSLHKFHGRGNQSF